MNQKLQDSYGLMATHNQEKTASNLCATNKHIASNMAIYGHWALFYNRNLPILKLEFWRSVTFPEEIIHLAEAIWNSIPYFYSV